MAVLLALCLGHMKHNKADASQAPLMRLEAENTWCPGLGTWMTLLGQRSGIGCGVCYPTTLDPTGFLLLRPRAWQGEGKGEDCREL